MLSRNELKIYYNNPFCQPKTFPLLQALSFSSSKTKSTLVDVQMEIGFKYANRLLPLFTNDSQPKESENEKKDFKFFFGENVI